MVIDVFKASLCIYFILLQVSKPISFRIKVQQAMNLPERIVKVSNPLILANFIPASVFYYSYKFPVRCICLENNNTQLTKSRLCVAKHTSLYIAVSVLPQ